MFLIEASDAETRRCHVSTTTAQQFPVIQPYGVGTHNMRLHVRRGICGGCMGRGGDAYYASLHYWYGH